MNRYPVQKAEWQILDFVVVLAIIVALLAALK